MAYPLVRCRPRPEARPSRWLGAAPGLAAQPAVEPPETGSQALDPGHQFLRGAAQDSDGQRHHPAEQRDDDAGIPCPLRGHPLTGAGNHAVGRPRTRRVTGRPFPCSSSALSAASLAAAHGDLGWAADDGCPPGLSTICPAKPCANASGADPATVTEEMLPISISGESRAPGVRMNTARPVVAFGRLEAGSRGGEAQGSSFDLSSRRLGGRVEAQGRGSGSQREQIHVTGRGGETSRLAAVCLLRSP